MGYKIAVVIPCRLESERLFGKQMQIVGNKIILQHLLQNLKKSKLIDAIILAISEKPSNFPLIEFCKNNKLNYFIGSECDVLKRLIGAAKKVKADSILRVGSENPFIYHEGVDKLIQKHIEGDYDLSTYSDLPLGSSFELIKLSALERSHKLGNKIHRSEYSTLYIDKNPTKFNILRVTPPKSLRRPELRLTVDAPEDLILSRKIYEGLDGKHKRISLGRIIKFLEKHPEIKKINSKIPLKYKRY